MKAFDFPGHSIAAMDLEGLRPERHQVKGLFHLAAACDDRIGGRSSRTNTNLAGDHRYSDEDDSGDEYQPEPANRLEPTHMKFLPIGLLTGLIRAHVGLHPTHTHFTGRRFPGTRGCFPDLLGNS